LSASAGRCSRRTNTSARARMDILIRFGRVLSEIEARAEHALERAKTGVEAELGNTGNE